VIVAVDARWLIRSLEYHHHDLFAGPDGSAGDLPEEDTAGHAVPIDYLDKIFQIPYVLLPPLPSATSAYLRALLPEPTLGSAAKQDVIIADADTPPRGKADEAPANETEDVPPAAGHDKRGQHRDAEQPDARDEPTRKAGGRGLIAATDLRPHGLQLTQVEIELMTRLSGLISTPRAAKKSTNLYRLIRIGIPEEHLAAFIGDETGGPYQSVQILLAILVGRPAMARRVFQRLLAAPSEADLSFVLSTTDLDHACQKSFQNIMIELERAGLEALLTTKVSEYQRWCPILARYSFHTRALAARPPEHGEYQ
jgi:hypothetical protein